MTQKNDEKTFISLAVKTNVIDEVLTKKYFQKVPMSDEDYLYSLFVFGIWKSKSDYDEFNLFKEMMLESGKVTKIELENI